jgi:hypothetical protein
MLVRMACATRMENAQYRMEVQKSIEILRYEGELQIPKKGMLIDALKR